MPGNVDMKLRVDRKPNIGLQGYRVLEGPPNYYVTPNMKNTKAGNEKSLPDIQTVKSTLKNRTS